MRKSELPITEISLKDFLKLEVIGFARRKHYYDDKGRRIDDIKAFVLVPEQIVDGVTIKSHYHPAYEYSKISWDMVDLVQEVKDDANSVISDNLDEPRCICLAIHTPASTDFLNKLDLDGRLDPVTGAPLTDLQKLEAKKQIALDTYSYLDKWLTPEGAQTYLIGRGITKLYSTRDYYECRDSYFKIPKKETCAIYLIRY